MKPSRHQILQKKVGMDGMGNVTFDVAENGELVAGAVSFTSDAWELFRKKKNVPGDGVTEKFVIAALLEGRSLKQDGPVYFDLQRVLSFLNLPEMAGWQVNVECQHPVVNPSGGVRVPCHVVVQADSDVVWTIGVEVVPTLDMQAKRISDYHDQVERVFRDKLKAGWVPRDNLQVKHEIRTVE